VCVCAYVCAHVCYEYPDAGEGIFLFVLEVLVKVDERVKEDGSERTGLQVLQADTTFLLRLYHIQHLRNKMSTLDRAKLDLRLESSGTDPFSR